MWADHFPVLKVSLTPKNENWEELDDKPGTTIGTKFSVLHCIADTVDVVFDR